MSKTVVVTLTDERYYFKAQRTIRDIRKRGEWSGDLVLITVGFSPSQEYLNSYGIIEYRVNHIDTSFLVEEYKKHPLKTVTDGRHLNKLAQWNKFYVFDDYFKKWNKVIFFDAGMRILDKVSVLESLPCDSKFLSPDDEGPSNPTKGFQAMLELSANPDVEKLFLQEFSEDILKKRFFLNCIWVYDTKILEKCSMKEMIEYMNKYPVCRCNEMTIMNILLAFKYDLWVPFPETLGEKSMCCWSEEGNTNWRSYYYLKYPRTISFESD